MAYDRQNMIAAVDGLLAHTNTKANDFFKLSAKDGSEVEAHSIFASTVCSHFLDTALEKGREAGLPDLNIVESILMQSSLHFEIREANPS